MFMVLHALSFVNLEIDNAGTVKKMLGHLNRNFLKTAILTCTPPESDIVSSTHHNGTY